jgi:hypothetical protein
MLVTRLPAIRFCLNHNGFEYFFKPDLSSMVSGPLKKGKLQISVEEPFANIWNHLQAFGAIRGPPPGSSPRGPKIGLLKLGIMLGGGSPGITPLEVPQETPRDPQETPPETPSQYLDHPGIVRIYDEISVLIDFSPTSFSRPSDTRHLGLGAGAGGSDGAALS